MFVCFDFLFIFTYGLTWFLTTVAKKTHYVKNQKNHLVCLGSLRVANSFALFFIFFFWCAGTLGAVYVLASCGLCISPGFHYNIEGGYIDSKSNSKELLHILTLHFIYI